MAAQLPSRAAGDPPAEIAANPTAQTWRSAVGLKDEIARGMREWPLYCYLPVQYLTAFRFVEGWDVMAETRTADDQMAIVVLLTLQHLAVSLHGGSIVLVACPAWALTTNVKRVLLDVGQYTDVTCFDCSQQEGEHNSIRSARVLVGTPGQLLKKMQEGQFNPGQVSMLVNYQVDEMVMQQVQGSLVELFRRLPPDHRMLFTATQTSPALVDLLFSLRGSPFVLTNYDNPGPAETMQQHYFSIEEEDRFDLLMYLVKDMSVEQVVLLCDSQASAEAVQRQCRTEQVGSMLVPSHMGSSQVVPPADTENRVFIVQNLTDENLFEVPKLLVIYDCPSAYYYRRVIDMFGNVRPDGIPLVLITPTQGNGLVKRLEDVTSRHIKELPQGISWEGILF